MADIVTGCNSCFFFGYLPIVSFYTAQTMCVESIQAKVRDVTYVYRW